MVEGFLSRLTLGGHKSPGHVVQCQHMIGSLQYFVEATVAYSSSLPCLKLCTLESNWMLTIKTSYDG